MLKAKKRYMIAFVAILFIILISFFWICLQNQAMYNSDAISVDFNSDTLEIVFSISDGYEFEWVNSSNEYLNVPAVDKYVQSVTVDASVIPVTKHDFLTFAVQSTKNSNGEYLNCEVLHQSNNQFIVEMIRKSDGKPVSFTFDY